MPRGSAFGAEASVLPVLPCLAVNGVVLTRARAHSWQGRVRRLR